MGKYMKKSKATGNVSMKEVSPYSLGDRTRAITTTATPASNSQDSCENEFSVADLPPGSVGLVKKDEECVELDCKELVTEGLEIEGSSGEINLVMKARESVSSRSTLETTLPNLIVAPDTVATPGCTKRQTGPTAAGKRGSEALDSDIPSAPEIDEFFVRMEQLQQQRFTEKYNFDFVNDLPLPGHYKWVTLGREE
ncbi:Cyclin-dependent kinase inhibitor 3 [Abeliophyllum distichum]|uniref:Cyclin-dependent kinase inhibitor n=1 Tax=Abeliophyllum distichum TaxID=126358 RepID=A0ABD1VTM9_9LAMI